MNVVNLRKKSNLGIRGIIIISKNELAAFFRNKGLMASLFIQPILYVAFVIIGLNSTIGNTDYKGMTISYAQYTTVGLVGLFVISQMSQAIYRVTIDKKYGLLALKLSSGVRPLYYIIGMSVYPILGLLIQEIVIYSVSSFFKIGIKLDKFLEIMLLSLIISLFWNALGILITMFINDYRSRDIVIRFVLTPLGFTAPVFYLLASAPTLIQWFGRLNPLTYQLNVIRDVYFSIQSPYEVVLIIVVSLLMLVITSLVIPKINLVLIER